MRKAAAAHTVRRAAAHAGVEEEPALSLPSQLREALVTARECAEKEGWFTVDLQVQVHVQHEETIAKRGSRKAELTVAAPGTAAASPSPASAATIERQGEEDSDTCSTSITWLIGFLGPTAYTVNPMTDARPRASPYRGGLFEATCSFPYNSSYPFCVPTIKFTGPVFHPHVYADGGVDPELTSVLWRSVAVPLASKVPPVLLAHLLLELLAYPTVPEPVVARKTRSPADERQSAWTVLQTEGVEGFERQARAVALSPRHHQRRSRSPHLPDSDTDDPDVLVVSTMVQALGLWRLILQGRVHDVHRLIDAGVDVHSCTGVPRRPLLSWAARSKAGVAHQVAIMQMLVGAGAKVNQQCPFGRSPLMEAAKTGSESAVYLLLAAEADVAMEDGCGSTAYDIALAAGHLDIAELVRPASRAPDPRLLLLRRRSSSAGTDDSEPSADSGADVGAGAGAGATAGAGAGATAGAGAGAAATMIASSEATGTQPQAAVSRSPGRVAEGAAAARAAVWRGEQRRHAHVTTQRQRDWKPRPAAASALRGHEVPRSHTHAYPGEATPAE